MLTTVIIPAAGRGHRFGDSSTPKQYQQLAGRPVLWHTLRRFEVITEEVESEPLRAMSRLVPARQGAHIAA